MSPRNPRDVNDAESYQPVRPKLHAQKAPLLIPDADGSQELQRASLPQDFATDADAFVYDDAPHWRSSLPELSVLPSRVRPSAAKPPLSKIAPPGAAAPKRPAKPGYSQKSAKAAPQKRKKGKTRASRPKLAYFYVGIITVCVFALVGIVIMMMPQIVGYFWTDFDNYAFVNGELLRYDVAAAKSYKQYRDYMYAGVIYPGVFVEDVHVGGMTKAEAEQALSKMDTGTQNVYSLTVAIGNKAWEVSSANVPASFDLGNVAQQAYAIGRSNTKAILGVKHTPFQERSKVITDLRENNVRLKLTAKFDEFALRAVVDEISAYITREPLNAEIQGFDFATRSFSFSNDQVGVKIDAPKLYDQIAQSLQSRAQGITITADPIIETPAVTREQLQKSFKMIAAYTTDTTNDQNRNTNIQLSCEAINGTVLMPGDVFSFNQKTGQRTIDKGYREAGAIAGGQSIDEVGGGICQVSSTLFNAVVRADLRILERSPHAWPSTYVNRGEDATVNWPNLDFSFRNNKESPIFVITYYKDRKCSAEIWGMSMGEGVSIDLHSELVKTIPPPSEALYEINISLPPGTSKEIIKARTGYVVDTYRVWLQNGKEIKREKLHTTTYRAYQQKIEYN